VRRWGGAARRWGGAVRRWGGAARRGIGSELPWEGWKLEAGNWKLRCRVENWTKIQRSRNIPPVLLVDNDEIVSAMLKILEPFRAELERIQTAVGCSLYVFGSPPRDAISHVLHGTPVPTPQYLDLFYDDSVLARPLPDVAKRIARLKLGEVSPSSLGGVDYVKVEGGQVPLEIFPFSGKFIYREYPGLYVSLSATLGSTDLNTSASCYDLVSRQLWSCGTLDGVTNRIVELQYLHPDSEAETLVRIVTHAHKLQFAIGPAALAFVKRRFSMHLAHRIRKQIALKQPHLDAEWVLEMLRTTKASVQ
jgi:hypothetical protein